MKYEGVVELAEPGARKGHFASTKRLATEPSKIACEHQGIAATLDSGKLTGAIDNLVHEQSVLRFSARFETEDYAATRNRLSKLPAAKENKFAVAAERLAKVDGHIAKCKCFISLQCTLVDKLKRDGQEFQRAERLLRSTMEIHDLCVSYRHVLLHGLDRLAAYERQSRASRKLALRRSRRLLKPVSNAAPKPCLSSRRSV
jgi:hypothetical protein